MNCSDISAFAPLYLNGELESARAEAFAAHLDACPACRAELEQLAAFDQQLRTTLLVEDIDSSSVDRRVRERIHAGQRTSRRWLLSAAGVAAVLLVAIVGSRTITAYRTKPLDAAAARDHQLEIVDRQPRKWFSDRATIERLIERQGLSSSAIAAFVPAGYHFTQGKLCLLDGQVFLHLVYANDIYRNNDGNFSFFLRHPDDTAASDIHSATFAAEHVARFQQRQLLALIVSEQSSDAVLRLAKSAAAVL